MSVERELDKWASWVLHRRDGDDPEQREKALEHLLPIRDRVLNNAQIRQRETLLDVGTGDGLIAFAAVDRVGPDGHVIASDVSADLVAKLSEVRRCENSMSSSLTRRWIDVCSKCEGHSWNGTGCSW